MNILDCKDGILIERSQNGDRPAFDELLGRHQARAYQYAYRLTHDSEEAGDVVAETMLRMFKGISTFRGNSSFTTWMYRITRNCFLDLRKKQHSSYCAGSTSQNDVTDAPHEVPDRGPSAYDIITIQEDVKAVGEAAVRLVEWQQTILTMRFAEMRSYEEISATLSLPIGTVKSRISRARNCLLVTLESQRSKGVRQLNRPTEMGWPLERTRRKARRTSATANNPVSKIPGVELF